VKIARVEFALRIVRATAERRALISHRRARSGETFR
jgi:hypothetical protein